MTARGFSLIAALIAMTTVQPAAQSATIRSDLLTDWTSMKDTMTKLAEAMPEERFGFKPTPAQRNYGEQILHVAVDNVQLMKLLGGKTPAPTLDKNAASKVDILKALGDSYDYGTAVIREQTDGSMAEPVQVPNFVGTRARLVWSAIGHAWDEYGVMTVYLRLNGIVPPASRR
ncbi:MAG TPA: DinB family protein [Vicinamibacterales bacterium]|nr:DinB family protein [Vicinamibacterales bacterium]